MVGRNTRRMDDEGWMFVSKRNNREERREIPNPYKSYVEKIPSSFFVTNLPENLNARGLWLKCEGLGRIVDAFIASKRSKAGMRFGFVRYVNVIDEDALAAKLSSIWFGSRRLYASKARFNRGESQKIDRVTVQHRVENGSNRVRSVKAGGETKSFASVVKGDQVNSSVVHKIEEKVVILEEQDLVQVSDSLEIVMVKVKEVETLHSLHRLLKEEGYVKAQVHYMGGLWAWIHFPSERVCKDFKENDFFHSFFSHIKTVSKNFTVDERVIWVDIVGLPLCAWKSSAFKKIASSIGRFLFFEDEVASPMGTGRICIATRKMALLSEAVKVKIYDTEFVVQVNEIGPWSMGIQEDSEDGVYSEEGSDKCFSDMEKDIEQLCHKESGES